MNPLHRDVGRSAGLPLFQELSTLGQQFAQVPCLPGRGKMEAFLRARPPSAPLGRALSCTGCLCISHAFLFRALPTVWGRGDRLYFVLFDRGGQTPFGRTPRRVEWSLSALALMRPGPLLRACMRQRQMIFTSQGPFAIKGGD